MAEQSEEKWPKIHLTQMPIALKNQTMDLHRIHIKTTNEEYGGFWALNTKSTHNPRNVSGKSESQALQTPEIQPNRKQSPEESYHYPLASSLTKSSVNGQTHPDFSPLPDTIWHDRPPADTDTYESLFTRIDLIDQQLKLLDHKACTFCASHIRFGNFF